MWKKFLNRTYWGFDLIEILCLSGLAGLALYYMAHAYIVCFTS